MSKEVVKSTGKTPHEMWVESLPWFIKCNRPGGCKAACEVRIMVFADPDEYVRRHPAAARALAIRNEAHTGTPGLPITRTAFGMDLVCISDMGACRHHKHDAETAAAQAPDWCHVWIDRGPEPDGAKLVFQVTTDIFTQQGRYPSVAGSKIVLTGSDRA